MCSPTRAALLTGRNHHHVAMGSIVNLAEAPTAVHLAATVPYGFQVSDAVGVGRDVVTALTGDYQLAFRYPGDIGRLRIHLGGATSR